MVSIWLSFSLKFLVASVTSIVSCKGVRILGKRAEEAVFSGSSMRIVLNQDGD